MWYQMWSLYPYRSSFHVAHVSEYALYFIWCKRSSVSVEQSFTKYGTKLNNWKFCSNSCSKRRRSKAYWCFLTPPLKSNKKVQYEVSGGEQKNRSVKMKRGTERKGEICLRRGGNEPLRSVNKDTTYCISVVLPRLLGYFSWFCKHKDAVSMPVNNI